MIDTMVVVIVYNRYGNLKRWLNCWDQCNQDNTSFTVIHNFATPAEIPIYKKLCADYGVQYVPRKNVGFDIGALQDVCRERLKGFNNHWKNLLWCTDDTWPMAKNFVQQYQEKLKPENVGCVAMEVRESSSEAKLHIRTTGFALKKEVAIKLEFPADPVTTKWECYLFEHKGDNTLLEQIERFKFRTEMVAARATNPLWDSEFHKRLLRMKEHERIFPQNPTDKITFVCPIYKGYPHIISSLLAQTYENWELILIHDGPGPGRISQIVNQANDKRIKYMETSSRVGNWGHKIRSWALRQIKNNFLSENTNFIVITNADNYHVPVFCEYLLKGFKEHPQAVATYGAQMVHSYLSWKAQDCKLERGHLDCAGVMIKKEVACAVGWNNVDEHSADWIYFNEIIARHGKDSFIKVPGCLLIHN